MLDVFEALSLRRTVRQFVSDYSIPREVLSEIIDLALDSPTGRNLQEIDLLVITNRAKIDEISRITIENMPDQLRDLFTGRQKELGVTNTVTCDGSALILLVANERGDSEFVKVDSGIVLMTIMAAAVKFGLASMVLGAVCFAKEAIEKEFGLKAGSLLVGIVLGKAREDAVIKEKTRIGKASIIE
jgi:nitroreductase